MQPPSDPAERLRQVFDHHLDAGLHHGAQLAVRLDGEPVVDLAGGVVAPDGDPTTVDRRHVLFSCTKPLAGVACLQLVESGALALEDPIVEHWPEYAEPGTPKATATVRHALSHQAGVPEAPFARDPETYADWERAVAAMEEMAVAFEPGTDAVYHGLTYGWLVGELVRRASGTPVDAYVRENVLDPLGMDDTHVGLPAGKEDDVATLVGFEALDGCREPTEDGYSNEEIATRYNTETLHRAVQPAANGVGTARDLARFYACLAAGGAIDGTRIVGERTLEEATTPQADLRSDPGDPPEPYGLGFELGGPPTRTFGAVSPARTFGHAGLGSSTAWADPETGLAVAYVTNGLRPGFEHQSRAGLVSHAVRELLG